MSNPIDERVVSMVFDNSQFGKNVDSTLGSLDSLNQKLNDMPTSIDGLDSIASSVETIASRFSALGAIAFTVMQNITNKAIQLGSNIVNSIMSPIVSGGMTRALNIEQAQFALEGLGVSWDKVKEDILYGVKDTAYGLDEAAKAASSLAASQVKLGTEMRAALRGISGVAAMTGSSYEDISNIFTKVAGQGRLMGDDLLSMSARGLNAAAILAKAMHTSEASVRQMVTEGKIDFKTFAKVMDDEFGAHAAQANKTFTGSMSNMRAALARIGAYVAGPTFKDLRNIFNALTPQIDKIAAALTPLMDFLNKDIKAGSKALVGFIKNLDFTSVEMFAKSFMDVVDTIKSIGSSIGEAWGRIFPPVLGSDVQILANTIHRFTSGIREFFESTEGSQKVTRIFQGLFAAFHIGQMILSKVFDTFSYLFSLLNIDGASILDFTVGIANWITTLDRAISRGDDLNQFFAGLVDILKAPIKFFQAFGQMLVDIFNGEGVQAVKDFVERIKSAVNGLKPVGDNLTNVFGGIIVALKAVWDFFEPISSIFVTMFKNLGSAVADMVRNLDFKGLNSLVGGTFLTVITVQISKFIATLQKSVNIGQGFIGKLDSIFQMIEDHSKAMQQNIKAEALLKIAGAMGILALSAVLLASVDSNKLVTALTAMSFMLKGVMITMEALNKSTATTTGVIKVNGIAVALTILAGAILLLTLSVRSLSSLNWEELIKGLIGVGGILTALALFTKFAKVSKGATAQAASILILAVGIKILASAVSDLGSLDVGQLTQGLIAITAILGILSGFSKLMQGNTGLVAASASILVLSVALNILAAAIGKLGSMSWETLIRGLTGMAGGLLIIAGAMHIMPKGMIASSLGLIAVGVALGLIANALQNMGSLSWEEIGKSLVLLAASLVILAAAMLVMQEGIGGAVAILVVAGALAILGPVLIAFAKLSWEEIAKGVVMLAGVFLILGIAGAVLTPVIPTLLGLGIAIALIGIGVLAAGIGVAAFAAALILLSVAGAAGTAAVVAMVAGLIGLIPMLLEQIGLGIVAMVQVLVDSASVFLQAAVTLITTILQAINIVAPAIITTLVNLIILLVGAIVKLVPLFVNAGLKIIRGVLHGIEENIEDIVATAIKIVANFIRGIADSIPEVIDSAFDLIISFVDGLADAIDKNVDRMIEAGKHLANAIIDGVVKGLSSGVQWVVDKAREVAQKILDSMMDVLNAHSPSRETEEIALFADQGLANGLIKNVGMVKTAGERVGKTALDSIKNSIGKISDAVDSKLDINPTIKPILDLSAVTKDAGTISDLLGNKHVSVDGAYAVSDTIASAKQTVNDSSSVTPQESSTTTINYTQNNNSPKALSDIEIYRNTRNQLALLKGSLNSNANSS